MLLLWYAPIMTTTIPATYAPATVAGVTQYTEPQDDDALLLAWWAYIGGI